jgi:ureidoacrylate peracid hydrolase
VSDGTSTMNDDWQRAAIGYALTNVAEIVTVSELMEAL